MKISKHHAISLITSFLILITPKLAYADQTYTWQKPPSHIVFNHITNNPVVGDERAFLSIHSLDQSFKGKTVKVQSGQTYALQIYYDNNAGQNLDRVAENTQIRLFIPSGLAKDQKITGYIKAGNAQPQQVESSVSFTSDKPFYISYQKGSAKIWNNVLRGKKINDSVVNSGALIGYEQLDGKVPGGFKYSGYVTAKVEVSVPQAQSTSTQTPSNVSNTGPGNTIGLFILVSFGGMLAHMQYSRRKANQQ